MRELRIEKTSEEKKTLETYQKIAKRRNETIGNKSFNPDFWLVQFKRFKTLLPKGRILEIGCGNGRDARFFCDDPDYYYFGIDACKEMVCEAQKNVPRALFRVMDLYDLDIPYQSFGGFWAASVYVHIPKKNIVRALLELRRVICPNGIGFIVMREGKGEHMISTQEGHERFYALYTDVEFRHILRVAGFTIVEKEDDARNKPELVYFVRT